MQGGASLTVMGISKPAVEGGGSRGLIIGLGHKQRVGRRHHEAGEDGSMGSLALQNSAGGPGGTSGGTWEWSVTLKGTAGRAPGAERVSS